MELGTAGALLAFAIRLEGHSAEFYERAASSTKNSSARDVFLYLAGEKRMRRRRVQRSRREFVNEMLLEPIEGLEGNDDVLESSLSADNIDSQSVLRLARELEESSQALYLNAAEKISHLPQLARVFKKLGEQSADHGLRLSSLDDRSRSEG